MLPRELNIRRMETETGVCCLPPGEEKVAIRGSHAPPITDGRSAGNNPRDLMEGSTIGRFHGSFQPAIRGKIAWHEPRGPRGNWEIHRSRCIHLYSSPFFDRRSFLSRENSSGISYEGGRIEVARLDRSVYHKILRYFPYSYRDAIIPSHVISWITFRP